MRLSVLLLVSAMIVGACSKSPDEPKPIRLTARTAPDSIPVAGGDVIVRGPDGYCIDKRGSRLRGEAAFVLLAGCSSITGNPEAGTPGASALLTASVDKQTGEIADPSQLLALLTSSDGQATLARDGRKESIVLKSSEMRNDVVMLHIEDNSENPTPGLQSDYLRGLFALNGRLITVTVVGFETRPIDGNTGLFLLNRFVASIRDASPSVENTTATQAVPKDRKGLFRTLFR